MTKQFISLFLKNDVVNIKLGLSKQSTETDQTLTHPNKPIDHVDKHRFVFTLILMHYGQDKTLLSGQCKCTSELQELSNYRDAWDQVYTVIRKHGS